jgi:signal transduction histidine kinase/PAS domain-containing protein
MIFTIFFYIFLLTAAISIFVSFLAWKRKDVHGATELGWLMLFTSIYSFFDAFEAASTSVPEKVFWSKISYIGAVVVPVLYFIFIMRYTGHKKVGHLKNRLLLFILPTITLILAFTNEKHHLVWSDFSPISAQTNLIEYYHGAWFWIGYFTYDYILLFFATVLLFDFIFRHKNVFRIQGLVIFLAGILPWAGGIIYLTDLNPISGFDISPASIMLSGILLIVAILKVGFLDLVPIAREMLVETLDDGIIVLDAKNRIQDINGVARSYLGLFDKNILGLPITSFDSLKPLLNAVISLKSFDQFELENLNETKTLKIIKQNIESESGSRLVVIRDISDQILKQMEIKKRDDLLDAITKATTLIIQGEDLEESMHGSLEIIGKATGINRIYIFRSQIDAEGKNPVQNLIYEWVDGSDRTQIVEKRVGHSFIEILIPDWYDRLTQGQVCCGKASDFDQKEKAILDLQDIKAIFVVPIFIDKRYWGFTGFDDCSREREWTSTEERLLTNAAGTIVAAYVRKKNQEELVAAKEKAEESDRLKTAFLTNMSHEIRTPMNSIMGFVSLLQEQNLTEEERMEYFLIVRKSGDRLLNTIQDIIDIAKIESGQIVIDNRFMNINEMNLTLYNLFRPEAVIKNLKFDLPVQIPSDLSIIKTDKEKVYTIMTQLIKNALKYTNKGFIEMGCKREPNQALFYVKDSGIGIPEKKFKSIFDRFVQIDGSNTRSYEGSGLGLSISKAYTEMLGGEIWVESSVDEGSTFYFQLPVL